MEPEKEKEEKRIIAFNPSSRTPIAGFDSKELDYIRKTIEDAALKMAEREDKEVMVIIMAVIRKKLRDDPTFADKLKNFLELELYLKPDRNPRRITRTDLQEDMWP